MPAEYTRTLSWDRVARWLSLLMAVGLSAGLAVFLVNCGRQAHGWSGVLVSMDQQGWEWLRRC